MWAGVRPGLQILWVCFWWTGRFDSDSLPPASFLRAESPVRFQARFLPRARRSPQERVTGLLPMPQRRKPKPFRAAKEVKRQARRRVGSPPPTSPLVSPKRKPPKHKKRLDEEE